MKANWLLLLFSMACYSAQKITTIQLNGKKYVISRMNPYNSQLNFYLAYEYCRSLNFELVSLETIEEANIIMKYLKTAEYLNYDFWTSGNNLGNNTFMWMSTGQTFNLTIGYINKMNEKNEQIANESFHHGNIGNCVAISPDNHTWKTLNCMLENDYICEQTKCFNHNYDCPLLSTKKGTRSTYRNKYINIRRNTTMTSRISTNKMPVSKSYTENYSIGSSIQDMENAMPQNVKSVATTFISDEYIKHTEISLYNYISKYVNNMYKNMNKKASLMESNITRSNVRNHNLRNDKKIPNGLAINKHEVPSSFLEVNTVGPYESAVMDAQIDQNEKKLTKRSISGNDSNDDSSTIIPKYEPLYKYNIRVRNNGRVLGRLPNN